MSRIAFAEDAWEEYLYWQTQDKKTSLDVLQQLINSLYGEAGSFEGQ